MNRLFEDLLDIEECLQEVSPILNEQQALAPFLDEADELRAGLLSTSLRTFAWLERERKSYIAAIGKVVPRADRLALAGPRLGTLPSHEPDRMLSVGEIGGSQPGRLE